MNHTATMFDVSKDRAKRRVLMHVTEAGPYYDDRDMVRMECKCGYKTDWVDMLRSEAKRGIPCPKCNVKGVIPTATRICPP